MFQTLCAASSWRCQSKGLHCFGWLIILWTCPWSKYKERLFLQILRIWAWRGLLSCWWEPSKQSFWWNTRACCILYYLSCHLFTWIQVLPYLRCPLSYFVVPMLKNVFYICRPAFVSLTIMRELNSLLKKLEKFQCIQPLKIEFCLIQLFVWKFTQHFLYFLPTKLQLALLKVIILFNWTRLFNNRFILDLFGLIHDFLRINIEGGAD